MSKGRYIRINKGDPLKREKAPVARKPIPTAAEYTKGTFKRYFVRRRTDHSIVLEIDKKQHTDLTDPKKGINSSLWEGFKITWRIRGRRHDEYHGNIRTYPGVYESNQRFIDKIKSQFPQIESVLRDFTEHAVIEDVDSGTNLTTNVEDHFHYVFIDSMGNGHTSMHVNPKNSNISHFHMIQNYVIQEAQDGCYPNCFVLYGYEGVGPHTHEMNQ